MAAQKGPLLKVKKEVTPGGGTFAAIAALRSKSIRMNNNRIDTTTDEDVNVAGQSFRTYIGGITDFEVTASAVPKDAASAQDLIADFNSGTAKNYQIEWENVGTWEGAFFPSSMEVGGEVEGVIEISDLTLSNSGSIAFTAAGA